METSIAASIALSGCDFIIYCVLLLLGVCGGGGRRQSGRPSVAAESKISIYASSLYLFLSLLKTNTTTKKLEQFDI